jgi:hypothetical protein
MNTEQDVESVENRRALRNLLYEYTIYLEQDTSYKHSSYQAEYIVNNVDDAITEFIQNNPETISKFSPSMNIVDKLDKVNTPIK